MKGVSFFLGILTCCGCTKLMDLPEVNRNDGSSGSVGHAGASESDVSGGGTSGIGETGSTQKLPAGAAGAGTAGSPQPGQTGTGGAGTGGKQTGGSGEAEGTGGEPPSLPDYAVAVTDGLEVRWPLDGDGSEANGAYPGTLSGEAEPAEDRFGNPRSALGSFMMETEYPGIAGGLARTVSLWVKTTSGSAMTVFSYGRDLTGPKQEFVCNVNLQFGELYEGLAFMMSSYTENRRRVFAGLISDGRWHHCVYLVREGSRMDEIEAYLDGVLLTQVTEASGSDAVNTSVAVPASVSIEDGLLDDVRVYGRALTAEEITAVYHEGGWDD